MSVFRFFEGLLEPTAVPTEETPPPGLVAFYWHYARQARWLVGALFCAGFFVAVLDSTIPVFIGRVVGLVAANEPAQLWSQEWPQLLGMAVVLLIGRPLALLAQNLITNQAIVPGLTNLIRWQSHWHVVRQSWSFFQNDFAGRIANRVMQTGPALRESVVAATNAVWYITVYGGSAIVLTASNDLRLAIPMALWFCSYVLLLRYFVPRLRDRSREMSEVRSALTGRVVDSYTNIQTVKLFARPRDEDAVVRGTVDEHTASFRKQQRVITLFGLSLASLNAMMVVGTGAMALWLWSHGHIGVGIVAMALPLTWQIANIAGWVAQNVTAIFENVGVVQEGMRSIAVPRQMQDKSDAGALRVEQGAVKFENLHFGYGTERGVLHGIDLTIAPGQRIGLIGPSGAGKSTLVNLLLRFYELEAGRILIDGQDIADGDAGKPARQDRDGDAGHLAAAPLDPRQHPLRPAGSDRRGGACGSGARPRARIHRRAGGLGGAARLRCPCRRTRREAVRRAASAHRDRARDPEGRADPGAGRSDRRARFRGRGGDPGAARRTDARAHRDRHRAPALHHRADGPAGRAGPRPHRGNRRARRIAGAARHLLAAVAAPVRRVPAGGDARAGGGGGKVSASGMGGI